MSKAAALKFLKHVSENPDLQAKLVSFAKEQGYEFTVDELSVEELRAVAGGLMRPGKHAI
jgi:hypothetical protein